MGQSTQYQRHIDGLRALAIVPVLLFHAHVPGFSGGYVGVDIFFVISGYLITRILAREVDAGRFSIVRFYERRARRILPALLVMVAFVLVATALLFLPGDFDSVPASALATALFVSNVFFFSDVTYFDIGADVKPLLHTWSLGIEEQFYIGFPILLMLVARFVPRWRVPIIASIAALSLALAIVFQADRTGFVFYLLPTRAWELFAGALLALTAPAAGPRWLRETLCLLALAAIGYATFSYDRSTPFPGAAALLPVLGAVALIQCAAGTVTGRVLSWTPLVAIGLISYSLYLWHWPLIVFTEYTLDQKLAGVSSIAVILGSIAAAYLSWRFIEQPFRDSARVGRRAVFVAGAAATGVVCSAAVAMLMLGGWPQRFAPEVGRMAAARFDVSPRRALCHDSASTGRPPCILGAPGVAPTALLWGDSHGVELSYALGRIAATRGRAIVERTQSSCPPVLDYISLESPRCAAINRQLLDAIDADSRLQTIYLVGFWESPAYRDTAPGLRATIRHLLAQGRRVVLIGPVPPNKFDVPRRLARLARQGKLAEAVGRSRADLAETEARLRRIAEQSAGPDFVYLDPADTLCPAATCLLLKHGTPLYFDHHHLSVTGAMTVLDGFTPVIVRSLDDVMPRPDRPGPGRAPAGGRASA